MRFMRMALEEVRKGRYIAPPNPSVGCVIVKDGCVISRGYTHAPGSCHAEIDALDNAKAAGADVRGSTVYVTLEPCAHYGRTPPCAVRLAQEGVGRVVAAVLDPNPLVAGKGLKILKDAGIEVVCGVCEEEAYESNIGFMTRMRTGRPWVRLKIATSLDGFTALENGQSRWITSEAARTAGRFLRARSQGLLTGSGTVFTDNPQMNVRCEGLPDPVKYIVATHAALSPDMKIFAGRPAVVFTSRASCGKNADKLVAAGIEVRLVDEAEGGLDLRQVIDSIGADQVNELHVEAGARLNGALMCAGLADEIVCYASPSFMGSGRPVAALPVFEHMDQVLRWKFHAIGTAGEDLELVLRKR